MPETKLMSLSDAVERFVADGDTVYAGYLCIPFALVHEVARQGKRNLEIVGASVVWQATELIMAGCCRRVRSGYLQGAMRPDIAALMSTGELEYEDYSNQTLALMLMAGALGIPCIPTRSFLGSDYLSPEIDDHPGRIPGYRRLHVMDSPFDGQRMVLVPAIRPDVVLMHAQRADREGNLQSWGHQGDARWGNLSGKTIIATVDELVPAAVIRADPSRTTVPGVRVSAVVHCPFGAHPTALAGVYDFDYRFIAEVLTPALASPESFLDFRERWLSLVPDRDAYLARVREVIGKQAFETIRVTTALYPQQPPNYGYARELNLPRLQGQPTLEEP